jgi:hypothetical protein
MKQVIALIIMFSVALSSTALAEQPLPEKGVAIMYVHASTSVYAAPERGAAGIGTLTRGDQVQVLERVETTVDRWYRVRPHVLQNQPAPAWSEGWVFSYTLTTRVPEGVDPATQLPGDPGAAFVPLVEHEPAPATGEATAEEHLTAEPAPAPIVEEATAEPERIIRVQACLDLNANRSCDFDEGIADVPVYILDSSGQRLAKTRTDETGLAVLEVLAPAEAALVINMPLLNSYQTIGGMRLPEPVIVTPGAPIPALLP